MARPPRPPNKQPIRRRDVKSRKPVLNVPQDEPLTPGLRCDRNVEAIGVSPSVRTRARR